ncbi:hypothetical protein O1M54_14370 [Streptomyces diastatochromogenes]|nr:hypothetical protein [Streptomyces diastatochromogenes]
MFVIGSKYPGPGEVVKSVCICRSCPRNSGGRGSSTTSAVSSSISAATLAIPAGPTRVTHSRKAEGRAPPEPAPLRLYRRDERQQEQRSPPPVLLGRRRPERRTGVPRVPQQRLRTLPVRGLTTPGEVPLGQRARQPYADRAAQGGVVVQQPCQLVEFGDRRVVGPRRHRTGPHGRDQPLDPLRRVLGPRAQPPYAAALLVAHRRPAFPGPRQP